MKEFRFAVNGLFVLLFSMALSSIARAQAAQTFVSAQSGVDTNPCSRTAPCRTFIAAIAQVQAGGEVIVLDPGDYSAISLINKAVTIVAEPGTYGGITAQAGTPIAVTVNAGAKDVVVLRGLTLNGLGAMAGIYFQAGGALHVENCVINGFSNNGIIFNVAADSQLFVKGTIVRNGGGAGIFISTSSYAAIASIDRCRLEKNSTGIVAGQNARVSVRDSTAAGNSSVGFMAGAGEMSLENCAATGNGVGIAAGGRGGGSTVLVSNSTITGNSTGLALGGGRLLSFGNNRLAGNTVDGSFTGGIPLQ